MKFLFLFFIALPVQALDIEIEHPCDSNSNIHTSMQINSPLTLGEITITTLDSYNVEYLGTSAGMNSIFGTPTGLDAMVVLSDTDMLSYGWCYSIDGVYPEDMPNDILVDRHNIQKIRWFFGYAEMKNGQWISYCESSKIHDSLKLCH